MRPDTPPNRPRCLVFDDPRFEDHRTGQHVKTPRRLQSIREALQPLRERHSPEETSSPEKPADEQAATLPLQFRAAPAEWDVSDAEHQAIRNVHDEKYLHRLEQFALHGGGAWDADTQVSGQSFQVAQLAARTALAAVDEVLNEQAQTALGLVRPPGHHAVVDNAMGFCLLNNIAIAARHAVRQHALKRVLIVDWDVHHGNGTQDIFYEDGAVWFYSVHRAPFYPGTGDREETGSGAGLGATRNLPLPASTTREAYLKQVTEDLTDFADRCRPELILISAGFDAHQLDPIGSLGLETRDFGSLTELLQQLAATHCSGRIVSLLEGGYHLRALADSVEIHLRTLAGLA